MAWRKVGRALRIAAFVMVGMVTILVLLPAAINVATGGAAPEVLGPYVAWLWPSVLVLSAVMVTLAVWHRAGDRHARIIRHRPDHPSHRADAVDRVEREILRRREGSLAEQVVRKLGLAVPPDPVLHRVDTVGPPSEEQEPPSRIADVFEETRQILLVVGAPGAGKSTLLLDLCAALLTRARADPEQPVPVLLDLASWSASTLRPRRKVAPDDFLSWLLREVAARYRVSVPVGRSWLAEGRLALLLDGLDEVAADDRDRCVEGINALVKLSNVPRIAVAGRVADYERLPEKLLSHHTVRIEPLERGQVEDYLAEVSPRLDGLRTALRRNPALWDVLRTPLVFDVMALTYRTRRVVGEVPTGDERELFDTYLVEMVVGSRPPVTARSAERTFRSLRFLARLAASPLWNDLVARGRPPSRMAWLGLLPAPPVWSLFMRVQPAALAGAIGALCLIVGLRLGVVVALVAGACLVTLVIVVDHFLATRLFAFRRPSETRSLGLVPALLGLVGGAVVGMALGTLGAWLGLLIAELPVYVAFGVVVATTFMVSLGVSAHLESVRDGSYWAVAASLLPAAVMVWTGPSPELLVGLGIGLMAGLATTLFVRGFLGVWCVLQVEHWGALRGRGRWWIRVALPLGLVGAAVGTALAAALGAPLGPLVPAPLIGLFIGLFSAPTAAREHLLPFDLLSTGLAELLARPLVLGELPWRRTSLLHFASDRMLLLQVDGEHRFAHTLLRDHVAACDPVELGVAVERRRAELDSAT